jgi:hypothetical protein
VSPEQAGEEILAGQPYVPCNVCKGEGKRTVFDEKAQRGRVTNCNTCFAKGWFPRLAYHEAAKQLGLDIPVMPLRGFW